VWWRGFAPRTGRSRVTTRTFVEGITTYSASPINAEPLGALY